MNKEKILNDFKTKGLEPERIYRGAEVLVKTENGLGWRGIIKTTKAFIVYRDGETSRKVGPSKAVRVKANVGGEIVYFS